MKSDAGRRSGNPTNSNEKFAQEMSSRKNKKSIERDGGVRNLDLINELADQGVSESVQQKEQCSRMEAEQLKAVGTGIESLEGFDRNITHDDLKSKDVAQRESRIGKVEQARTRNDVKLKRDIVLMKSNNSSRVDTSRVVITAQSGWVPQNTVTQNEDKGDVIVDINTLGGQDPGAPRPQNARMRMEMQNSSNGQRDPRIQIITQLPNQRNIIYKNNLTSQFRRLEPSTSKNSE